MYMEVTDTGATWHDRLQAPYELPQGAVDFYRANGYVKLKNVLSPDLIDHYGAVITELVIRLNTVTKPMNERTTYERAFLQIMNLWTRDETARAFVFGKRLAKIATDLMGVSGVRLYHDQALYKEPSGGFTPWHADQFYWPLASPHTVTAWIPLQATPMHMGPLAFAAGSQRVELGRDLEISDQSEKILSNKLQELQFAVDNTPFDLGEVSFHAGWTFHRAGPNTADQARKVMTMIYMDKDQVVMEPRNTYQRNDRATWLSNWPVGTTPDGPLNPILFQY